MKIKLSKSQWEKVGKTAGWMKAAQVPQAQNQSVDAQHAAVKLNQLTQPMLPNNASAARNLISQLVQLIDTDAKQRQQAGG